MTTSIEELEAELYEADLHLRMINDHIKDLEERRGSFYENRKRIQDEIAKIKLANNPDWSYLLQEKHGSLHYKTLKEKLNQMDLELYGSYRETGQYGISFALHQNDRDRTDKIQASLEEILPHILPIKSKDRDIPTAKHIQIFEYTLSQGGIYEMLGTDDGAYHIMRTTYSRPKIQRSFSSLRECLLYIEKYHPYEKKDMGYYDDDSEQDC